MKTPVEEIVSAFLDDEETDPGELAAALASAEGRSTLRDFIRLRAALAADDSLPGRDFYPSVVRALEAAAAPAVRRRWWSVAVPIPAPALAAVILAMAALALWFGLNRRPASTAEAAQPPSPERVIRFVPGEDWK